MLILDVFQQALRADFRPVDVAHRIGGNAFRRARAGGFSNGSGMKAVTEPYLAFPILIPRLHPSWFLATDSDSEAAI